MSKRSFAFFLFIYLFSHGIGAQTYEGWSNGYTHVFSYDGASNTKAFSVKLATNSPLEINRGWRLSVKVLSKSIGKEFPIHKLVLQPFTVEGVANDPGPLPALSQLGIAPTNYLQKNSDVFLIPSSSVPLFHRATNASYFDFQLSFNLVVSEGSYLNSLRGVEYPIELIFTFRDANNHFMGAINLNHTIRVNENLSGIPPIQNNFSLQISNSAKSGLLEVNSKADYLNGASVIYNNGIIVASNTPYQLTVRSQTPTFISEVGRSLSLDIVQVSLVPTIMGDVTLYNTTLSTTPQLLLKGASTNSVAHSFNLKYSTQTNDSRLFQSESDIYRAALTYEITAQ